MISTVCTMETKVMSNITFRETLLDKVQLSYGLLSIDM